MSAIPRAIGEFCWINVFSPDSARDRAFFAALFGWTFVDIPSMGHRIQLDGLDVGRLFPAIDPLTRQPIPAGIGVMVHVRSADAAAAWAISLGGWANAAFDVGPPGRPLGRMADCHDPLGAHIDVWQPAVSTGMECDPFVHGSPSWFELATTDVAAATKFYTSWLGWTSAVRPMGDFDYTMFIINGATIAGVMPILPHMQPMPTHWAVFMTVRACDDAVEHAVALGGEVCVAARDIGDVGRFAGILSPTGVMFYVIAYSSPA